MCKRFSKNKNLCFFFLLKSLRIKISTCERVSLSQPFSYHYKYTTQGVICISYSSNVQILENQICNEFFSKIKKYLAKKCWLLIVGTILKHWKISCNLCVAHFLFCKYYWLHSYFSSWFHIHFNHPCITSLGNIHVYY